MHMYSFSALRTKFSISLHICAKHKHLQHSPEGLRRWLSTWMANVVRAKRCIPRQPVVPRPCSLTPNVTTCAILPSSGSQIHHAMDLCRSQRAKRLSASWGLFDKLDEPRDTADKARALQDWFAQEMEDTQCMLRDEQSPYLRSTTPNHQQPVVWKVEYVSFSINPYHFPYLSLTLPLYPLKSLSYQNWHPCD